MYLLYFVAKRSNSDFMKKQTHFHLLEKVAIPYFKNFLESLQTFGNLATSQYAKH